MHIMVCSTGELIQLRYNDTQTKNWKKRENKQQRIGELGR